MSRAITKRTFAIAIAIAIATILACACVLAFTAPHKAHAADLAPATLTAQAAEGNTTMYYAQELKSGKGAIGTFESKDNSNTNLYEYWYKFKTSNRWSTYSVKIESIDGRYVLCSAFKSDGSKDKAWHLGIAGGGVWNAQYATYTDKAATGFNTEADPDSWYYFEVSPYMTGKKDKRTLRYDQYKITVTEHPIIKRVTGVKAAKRAKRSITLKWNDQTNATKYQVKWKKKGGSWKTTTVTANSKKFTKLKKNKKYQFKVRAYCANGYDLVNGKTANWTAWSTTKTAKTKK